MAADDTTIPTAPPDADRLAALDEELWRRVLVHLRRSLAEVAAQDAGPRLRRLVAAPTSRLVAGRARRDAAAALAAGGPLWVDLRRRVTADPDLATDLAAALRHPDVAGPPAAQPGPPPGADPEEVERLRERARQLRGERDRARRRAEGERARADREVAAREELAAELAAAQERIVELEGDVAAAAAARTAAVDRERRRGEAALAEVTEQLRDVRREQQEQARRHRAAAEAQQAREQRRATPARPARPRAPRLVPGRPSRLPEPVRWGTTEAVDLLLHAGRLVLVDGYNVTRSHRDDLSLEHQRRWLVNLLAGAAATRRIEPRVVFDGHASQGPGSTRRERGVVVVFTPEGVTADDDLVFEVAAIAPDRPVVVVTDDRELRDRLAPYRVDLVPTAGLLAALR